MKKIFTTFALLSATSLLFCQAVQANCPSPSTIDYKNGYFQAEGDYNIFWQNPAYLQPNSKVMQFREASAHNAINTTVPTIACLYTLANGNGLELDPQFSNGFDLIMTDSQWQNPSGNTFLCPVVSDVKQCPFVPA